MGNDYKKIVLLKGFQHISDKCFNMIKSLLAEDLKLTSKMQDEYDRVKIANLMEVKFQGPACVDKLIELVKEIDEIKDLAKTLRNEKLKVMKKNKAKGATSVQKHKQDKSSLGQSTSTANEALGPESVKNTPVKEKKTTKTNESKRMKLTEEQSQLPGLSGISIKSTKRLLQTPQRPPSRPSGSSSTKKKSGIATKPNDLKGKMISCNQSQLPGTSATSLCPTVSSGQITPMFPPTPFGNVSSKKEENACLSIGKTEDITTRTANPRMKLSLERSPFLESPVYGVIPIENCLQTPQKLPPTTSSSSSTKKPRLKSVPKEASREEGFQRGPKEVMVLKATELFTYDVARGNMMFHATVATESQFFQVKIFNVALKEKFIPNRTIVISDYIGRNGFLEVFHAFSVSDVNPGRKMEISKSLIQKAKATPKISHLYLQDIGTFVNGVFLVHKKWVCNELIYYEIQDDTGVMEVMVYGQRLTSINCEEGDRLTLVCFELAKSGDKRHLRSEIHSFIKVTKARKSKEQPHNPDSYMETYSELFF
ncbi:interferon-activable protein 203-like [Moschus berezovskii]|uniref:interferon-activable protein 203-like n=1 Tax=Moschus berezovskii TaxID=68408 RepID=UPI0024438064|nr:interferon-activable protein 203-like [Moschus berezovskii]